LEPPPFFGQWPPTTPRSSGASARIPTPPSGLRDRFHNFSASGELADRIPSSPDRLFAPPLLGEGAPLASDGGSDSEEWITNGSNSSSEEQWQRSRRPGLSGSYSPLGMHHFDGRIPDDLFPPDDPQLAPGEHLFLES